jgi:hypothetical protein
MEEREKNEYYLVSGCVAIAPYRREHIHQQAFFLFQIAGNKNKRHSSARKTPTSEECD